MGREAACTVRFGGQASEGKALLETKELLFRGDIRLRIPFDSMTSVTAQDGVLAVAFGGQTAEFQIGKPAAKWMDAILHPPSLLDKLGVSETSVCATVGSVPEDMMAELPPQMDGGQPVGLLFFGASAVTDLAQVPALIPRLTDRGALWIVYPKKNQAIRELDVLEAGRTEGLVDTKVVSVSPTHTALRFTRRRGV